MATRKTIPGFREFEKEAVVHGGGRTHRIRLDDGILIKDNHLKLNKSISKAVMNSKKKYPDFIYELEYEKFVSNPILESQQLINYCSLEWNEKCLEYYKRKDVISQTASNIQIREAIYKTSNEKYLPYKKLLDKYGNKYSWFN